MRALTLLGNIDIPDSIAKLSPGVRNTWPRERLAVWEIVQQRPHHSGGGTRQYLSEDAVAFMDSTLKQFEIPEWDTLGHTLVVFGDVEAHQDDSIAFNGRTGAFLHIVIEGDCTLQLCGATDRTLRKLRLNKGMVFWFNPSVTHLVTNASQQGVVTLSAVICP